MHTDVKASRPRVELTEGNLLSGFMMEFGKGVVQQA